MKKINTIITVISLISGLLFSVNSFAREWTQPLTIKDISHTADEGRFPGHSQLRVTFNELPTTSICKPSEALAVYAANDANSWTKTWLSILLSAQAQNKKVRILNSTCYADNIPNIVGVKLLRD